MKSWPWNLNKIIVYTLVISAEGVVTRNFLKYLQNTGLTKNLKSWAKSSTITNVSYRTHIPRTRSWTLEDMMNFLPLNGPNLSANLG